MIDKLRKLAASKIKPMPHQERVALKFSEQTQPGGGLIVDHDVGTGKTMTSILAAQRTGKPLVAIVPAALRENYRKELAASGYEGDATVVSYHEAMRMAKNPEFRDKVSDSVVVYDEAHRMGSPGSKMSQLPSQLPSHKNLLLTGTTMRNDPSELAPLLRATGKPVSEKEFRKQFTAEEYAERGLLARMRGAKPRRIGTKAVKAQEFRKLVDDVIDTHQKTQEHMPSVTSEHIDVPMSSAQVRAYDAIMDGNPGVTACRPTVRTSPSTARSSLACVRCLTRLRSSAPKSSLRMLARSWRRPTTLSSTQLTCRTTAATATPTT